ncbi:MAG: hypothetical protein ACYS9T_02240 [Planctomycetota bacterium]|jgi:hypothetical protein
MGLAKDARITLQVTPDPNSVNFGLRVRCSQENAKGYELRFSPQTRSVQLYNEEHVLREVDGLDRSFALDIILKDDIIDVCFDNRQTLVSLVPKPQGDRLLFFCQKAAVLFDSIEVLPLLEE